MYNFSGQNVVVTGASRGIGKAITMHFLQNGAHVIGVYDSNTQAAQKLSDQAGTHRKNLTLHQCDISSHSEVEQLFQNIEETFSTIDVLINNAGIRRDSIVALMAADDWQRVIDVNLTGSYFMAKQAVLLMLKKKYGRIITITSPVAHLGFAGQANYAASKAGQIAMSKSLAKETARKKITVNCVSPGFIDTDFINDLPEEQLSAYKKMVPMRRFGSPEEVAEAVLFLASPGASYITGSILEVNGGL
ncbi:MAG: SDR family NAD(P)-dependent oxidoreductase [Desulfopila sp.]|jgi:3-oxoacyl-[acyl-carrier protein] reductase|nr:SDR family NAD(P)-dependent oxidoreductase [Desulfopila sp.]